MESRSRRQFLSNDGKGLTQMLQLTKKVEYALMALSHLAAQDPGKVVTVRDVSDRYKIPAKLLAKVFHTLKRSGLVRSHQGKHGGYSLVPRSTDVSLARVMAVFEDSADLMVCEDSVGERCRQYCDCNIRGSMGLLNDKMRVFMNSVTLDDFVTNNRQQAPSQAK